MQQRLRNNTSFPKQNYEILKKITKDQKDPLRYHQRLVHDYVVNGDARGILIYHKMGAGKSILGVSICESFLQEPGDNIDPRNKPQQSRQVIFMAAKSLHDNFKESVTKYQKMSAEKSGKQFDEVSVNRHVENNYEFISLNASNMITQVHRAIKKDAEVDAFDDGVITADEAADFAKLEQFGNLDHTILVIDEAHNLFNSISNGSKNAIGLYHLIMKAKDIKIVFLTGSPIVNDPFEIAIAMNMIAGPLGKDQVLFGEDYMDFSKYFVGAIPADRDGQKISQPYITRKDKFINRIIGLISYYGADDESQKALYPEQLPIIVDRVPMSAKQYAAYISARDREIEESSRASGFGNKNARMPLSKPQGASSSYRVRSRQISNFFYPEYASKSYKDDKGYLRYEKYIDKLKEENLRFRGSDGAGGDESKFGLEVWMPKGLQMLYNIQRHCPFNFIEKPDGKSSSPVKIVKTKTVKVKAKTGKGEVSISVRPIIQSDWVKIKQAHKKAFDENMEPIEPMSNGYIALDGKKTIGYLIIDSSKNIEYLRVIPSYQRRGIARILITLGLEKYPGALISIPKSDGNIVLDKYKQHGFKLLKETKTHWFVKHKVKGTAEAEICLMEAKDRYETLEVYKKIFGNHPEFSLDDNDIKIYLAKVPEKSTNEIIGLAVYKPGFASINRKRGGSGYMMALGVLDDRRREKVGTQLLNTVREDNPKIYLKVDREWKDSDGVKKFYEQNDFVTYRESGSHWYMRRIMGGKEKGKDASVIKIRPKAGIGPGLIYSQFIDSGVGLIGKVLSAHGFIEIKNLDDALKHKKGAAFAIISGQVDPDLRSELLRIFNSIENKRGEHLAILLVTSTGAEGLDLKNIRHIHVYEPYWHWARIAQVLARGVRMGSHLALPESERTVQPYIYLADYPAAALLEQLSDEVGEGLEHIKKQMEKEDTTDVSLYQKSIDNQVMIASFLKALQEGSVDCLFHYKGKLECRLCAPTDEPLFVTDLDKDIKTPNPCEPLTEKTVKAKGITIDVEQDGVTSKREFMYTVVPDDAGRKQIHIYEDDPELGGYAEIFEDHALYEDVYQVVKKKEKL